MKYKSFTNLHAHTEASISDGLFHPRKWVEALKQKGFKAHTVTDHGTMASLYQFYKLMRAEKMIPLLGCEFYYVDEPTKKDTSNRKASHLILIAKDYDGFRNMMRLSKLSYTDGYYYKPRIGREWLEENKEGLVCLSACQGGVLSNEVWRESKGEKGFGLENRFNQFINLFGEDFYVEFQAHNTLNTNPDTLEDYNSQEMINKALYERLKDLKGFRSIATNDCHYILKEHAQIQTVIKDISWGKPGVGESSTVTKDHSCDSLWLKSGQQVTDSFRLHHEYLPDAFVEDSIRRTEEVLEKCKDFEMPKDKRYLPKFRPLGDSKDLFKRLAVREMKRFLADTSLHRATPKEYIARFKKEYGVISKYKLEDYFLIVWDLIRFAKKNNIYTGLGRGSAAGCLISFLLDIVQVDPLEYNLLFERFLNENRCETGELPDIDLDFESERRGEIKEYIYKTYGSDNVCEIGTYGRMKLKTSLIDFAKATGAATHKEILEMTTKLDLDKESVDDLEAAMAFDPKINSLMTANPDLKFMVGEISGQIKSQGVHPAGLIICSDSVAEITPVKSQANNKTKGAPRIVATQFEDKTVIAQGLMKVDVLGLKEYDVIHYVVENAPGFPFTRETYVKEIMKAERKKPDQKVWDQFRAGRTEAVFQFACLSGDTVICIKTKKTIRDVYNQEMKQGGRTQLSSLLLDEGKWRRSSIKAIKATGVKKTYLIVTNDNRFVRATADHKFLTPEGWQCLKDLKVNDKLGFKLDWGDSRLDGLRLCTDCGQEKGSGAERCYSCSAGFYKNPKHNREKLCKPKTIKNSWAKGGIPKNKLEVMMKKRAVTWASTLAAGWVNPLKGVKRPEISGRNNPMFGRRTKSKMGFREDLGHFVRSTWEADYARVLNLHGVKYLYEPETFDLGDSTYTPDFYLPLENKYVEIKGWMTEKSQKKIDLFRLKFPEKTLEVVNRTEFAELALKYKSLVAWECPKFPKGFVWEEIKSIEYYGEEETFDLCMNNSAHNYVANGFVTHNSDGMKKLLIEMKPDRVNDLIAANALYRPGCLENGWHTQYCRRKNGEEEVEYVHEDVETTLGETYGVCVAEDSLVTTSTGRKMIQDIAVGEYVQTETGEFKRVLKTSNNGMRKTVVVRVSNGEELCCTPDHRVLTQRGWTEASLLNNDDLIKSFWTESARNNLGCDKDWLIGLAIADGGMTGPPVEIACSSREFAERVAGVAVSAYGLSPRIYWHCRCWYVSMTGNKSGFYNRNPFYADLRRLGLFGKNSYTKFLPENCSLSMVAGFIEGDGCLLSGRVRVKNETLARDLFSALQSFRIPSSYFLDEDGANTVSFSDYRKIIPYRIRNYKFNPVAYVPRSYLPKLKRSNEDRQHNYKKCQYISRAIVEKYSATIPHDLWSRVLSVKCSSEKNVYDLSVEGIHSFVVGGLVVHNCVYQEQFMEVIHRLGDISLVDSDTIRSALGKKDKDKLNQFRDQFVTAASTRVSSDQANDLWDQIEKASGYTFNKCFLFSETIYRNWAHCEPLNIGEMYRLKNGDRANARAMGKEALFEKWQHEGYGQGWSMRDGKLHPNRIVDIRYEGQREVYRCITESGRKIDVTLNHKFPTPNGEKKLEELKIGDELYVNLGYKPGDTTYRFTDRKGGPQNVVNGEKGLLVGTEKIISIEFFEMGDVYDVEMEAPAHNLAVASGIIASNSHSAAYSVLAYISQYLKVHYPAHFWAAQLHWDINKNKMEDLLVDRRAAQDMGVKYILPDVNESKKEFYVTPKQEIVWSIRSIGKVGPTAAEEILRCQPYSSFKDFYTRVNKGKVKFNIIESLIFGGAFDTLGDRRDCLKQLYVLANAKNGAKERRFKSPSEEQIMMRFRDSIGFFERRVKDLKGNFSTGIATETDLRAMGDGERITVGGVITDVRVIQTKKKDPMGFVTIMDLDEIIEVTVFPTQFGRFRSLLKANTVVEIVGKKSTYGDKQNAIVGDYFEQK